MTGGADDHDPPVDLTALTDDQRAGLACVNCGRAGGPTRVVSSDRAGALQLVAHADTDVCLRYISRSSLACTCA